MTLYQQTAFLRETAKAEEDVYLENFHKICADRPDINEFFSKLLYWSTNPQLDGTYECMVSDELMFFVLDLYKVELLSVIGPDFIDLRWAKRLHYLAERMMKAPVKYTLTTNPAAYNKWCAVMVPNGIGRVDALVAAAEDNAKFEVKRTTGRTLNAFSSEWREWRLMLLAGMRSSGRVEQIFEDEDQPAAAKRLT